MKWQRWRCVYDVSPLRCCSVCWLPIMIVAILWRVLAVNPTITLYLTIMRYDIRTSMNHLTTYPSIIQLPANRLRLQKRPPPLNLQLIAGTPMWSCDSRDQACGGSALGPSVARQWSSCTWTTTISPRLLSFGKHDFLRVLYLDGNKYREENAELSEICGSLPQLQELYLRNDGISRFGVAITTFAPRLRLLHLDRNRIESTEFLVNVPVSLAYLHMDDNRIPRIEKNHLKNVEELSVSGNAITQLCRSDCDGNSSVLFLDGAVRLRKLNASRNLITYVAEDAFKDAKALQQLDLSGNRIEKFASFVFHTLETITDLRLSNNRLTSVPSISSLVHLRHLDLSGNQIITISCESFQFLKKLETLLLANNLLNRMSVDHFKKMISLRTMDLSGNQFIDLPTKLLSNSPSLRVLRFRNNKIKDLAPLREEQSSSIFELHLQENPLLHVRVAMLHPGRLPHLVLYLKDANERYCADDDDEGNKDDDKDSDEDSWT
ncbi:uncharacterized protein LOC116427350 isoform X3 [Nomia melanderi]|uniref:uncharacterized protein LOC116427350 isoform X3 n=1 Tax=Nomia melanderi TaxID=2448451 RepID=UPI003FCE37D7